MREKRQSRSAMRNVLAVIPGQLGIFAFSRLLKMFRSAC
jgi:hypothetical protein